MSLKFRDEIDFATCENLMKEDGNVVYGLSCLASNIKKTFLVSSLICREQGKTIVQEHDKKSLFQV
jgi:hypothetical protein